MHTTHIYKFSTSAACCGYPSARPHSVHPRFHGGRVRQQLPAGLLLVRQRLPRLPGRLHHRRVRGHLSWKLHRYSGGFGGAQRGVLDTSRLGHAWLSAGGAASRGATTTVDSLRCVFTYHPLSCLQPAWPALVGTAALCALWARGLLGPRRTWHAPTARPAAPAGPRPARARPRLAFAQVRWAGHSCPQRSCLDSARFI